MITMNASDARTNVAKVWEMAAEEPVTIESSGKPIAVVIHPDEYRKLTERRRPRIPGTMKALLSDVDIDGLLATPVDDVFAGYM